MLIKNINLNVGEFMALIVKMCYFERLITVTYCSITAEEGCS